MGFREYRSPNRFDAGYLLLVPLLFIAALVVAGLGFLVAKFIYLVILLPLGMGVVGGGFMAWAMRWGKVTSSAYAILCGLLFGLLAFTGFHYARYLDFGAEIRGYVVEEIGSDDPELTNRIFEEILQEETGSTGFLGYMKLRAQEGMAIGRVGRSNQLPITGIFVWIYWGVEFLLITAIATAFGMEAVGKPFCAECKNWYSGKLAGRVETSEAPTFLQRIQEATYRQAGQLIQHEPIESESNYLKLELGNCACPSGDDVLTVFRITRNHKGKYNEQQLVRLLLTPQQRAELFHASADLMHAPA